jgi:hypothetical protein
MPVSPYSCVCCKDVISWLSDRSDFELLLILLSVSNSNIVFLSSIWHEQRNNVVYLSVTNSFLTLNAHISKTFICFCFVFLRFWPLRLDNVQPIYA